MPPAADASRHAVADGSPPDASPPPLVLTDLPVLSDLPTGHGAGRKEAAVSMAPAMSEAFRLRATKLGPTKSVSLCVRVCACIYTNVCMRVCVSTHVQVKQQQSSNKAAVKQQQSVC